MTSYKIVFGHSKGILENRDKPFSLLLENLDSIHEIIDSASKRHFERLMFIGSSCMYPDKDCALTEEMLGTGAVYQTNAGFSYLKLFGWQLCQSISKQYGYQYFVAIPCDIFGDVSDSHFITEIMRKMHRAKFLNLPKVTLYGTGSAIRHPIYKDDFDKISKELVIKYNETSPVNIATPVSYAKSIRSIANDIRDIVGYHGDVWFDCNFPDGQKVKILSNERMEKILAPKYTPWIESLEKFYEELKEDENKNLL